MTKKILIIVGDYVEFAEVTAAYKALKSIGYEVDKVCPGKKPGDTFVTAIHEFKEGFQTYSEKKGNTFPITADIETINVTDYEGLWLPGGRSPEYLRTKPRVIDIVRQFMDRNKPIVALCHGVQLLMAVGPELIKGRRLACIDMLEADVRNSGFDLQKVKNKTDVFVDGNIVSGGPPACIPEALSRFYDLLGVKISLPQ
ncbi:UNKNOWN [Stylonychia lemnae]|uniref:DJ-1/PfpI domain-containing protein n=1 Tax=Stylonychia lemnae TaxID=5949 RepID=A0A078A4T7_STYLE|nr:UNKNOWN [Stylonychia lemnae]|eukprot:CDW75784.1 UNKNOWN [Stylonychia lemnae]